MKLLKSLALSTMLLAAGALLMPVTVSAQKQTVKTASVKVASDVREVKAGEKIAAKPKKLTIIDFNATWCGPCQQFKPIFHKAAKEYGKKIDFLSVDTDNCPELAKEFKVNAIPQITAIKPDGTKVTKVGFMDEATFNAWIKELQK